MTRTGSSGRGPRTPKPSPNGPDAADDADTQAWRRLAATVRPLKSRAPAKAAAPAAPSKPPVAETPRSAAPPARPERLLLARIGGPAPRAAPPSPHPAAQPGSTIGTAPLDRGWERRLGSGRIEPDLVVDLHGHTLAGAHGQLARALDRAVAEGARAILLIAGKRRGADEAPRGAIRRELTVWLEHSRHAGRILAVRNAHPRHGGAGALYLILRKPG